MLGELSVGLTVDDAPSDLQLALRERLHTGSVGRVTLDGATAKVNTTLANALGIPSADGATLGTAVVTANIR